MQNLRLTSFIAAIYAMQQVAKQVLQSVASVARGIVLNEGGSWSGRACKGPFV
jgi:hypothetical protein